MHNVEDDSVLYDNAVRLGYMRGLAVYSPMENTCMDD